jgi:UDP-N-acetylglucosamine 2-epimerase (non-hydrolysing)
VKKKVLVIFGTRPEVIKLAPVVFELRRRPNEFECVVCSTGQHRQMVEDALQPFGLAVDIQLDAMSHATNLAKLTSKLFSDIDDVLAEQKPDWTIVQGDTTSAYVGAMCSYYRGIKVAHVEAGLRTYNKWAPFPEEINRTHIGKITDLHLAPTPASRDNLLKEGIKPEHVLVTGNTVVDALKIISAGLSDQSPASLNGVGELMRGYRTILVTTHRRESFGSGIENICTSIRDLVTKFPDTCVVFPVHLNPNVRASVNKILGGHERIKLLEPVDYLSMIYLMSKCYIILSDSGGIQEEAPSFAKPLLVLRETTERPEVVHAGCAKLVGTDPEVILKEASQLLSDAGAYRRMTEKENPFGDGTAAKQIVDGLLNFEQSK